MSVLEKNLTALRRRFTTFDAEILAQHQPDQEVLFSPSRSGDVCALWKGRSLCSSFDPVKEAQRAVGALAFADADYAILIGFGLGHLARELRRQAPELPLLVLEPATALFLRTLQEIPLTDILSDPLTSFMFQTSPGSVRLFMDLFSGQKALVVPHRPYAEAFAPFYEAVLAEIRKFQTKLQINSATLTRFAPLWIANLTRNLPRLTLARPLSALEGLFGLEGAPVPAVICAAGPSLNEDLQRLKTLRGRFILIAVDTAHSALLKAGLTPDFLVFMDGQYWNSRHVDELTSPSTWIVTELSGPARAFRLRPQQTLVAQSHSPFCEDLESFFTAQGMPQLGSLKSGGSVATSAWELARFLGLGPLFFSGLDLGYPQAATHVKGSLFEEASVRQGDRLWPAETRALRLLKDAGLVSRLSNEGTEVLTDPRMDLYREWFEVACLDHPEITTYNLSPSGVFIAGMKKGGWEVLSKHVELALGLFEKRLAERALDQTGPLSLQLDDQNVSKLWLQELQKAHSQALQMISLLDTAPSYQKYAAAAQNFVLPALRKSALSRSEKALQTFPINRHNRELLQKWQQIAQWIDLWIQRLFAG